MLSDLRRTIREFKEFLRAQESTSPSMEIIYRDLFLRELRAIGIEDEYYPVGSAASHAFLYFLARTLRTLPVPRILELGAGQTTLLIDRAKHQLGLHSEVETIEHDEFWAAQHQAAVRHPVIVAPLGPRTVEGHRIEYYTHSLLESGPSINLLLVDGPPAYKSSIRFNRLGALEIIKARIAPDFIVVVDDSQRPGEDFLVQRIRAVLKERKISHRAGEIRAKRRLTVIAGGELLKASYF